MPRTNRSSWPRRLVILVAAVGLLAAACGNASDEKPTAAPSTGSSGTGAPGAPVPGVTADEIKFSAIGTNSNNPLGTCVLDCYADGIKAYFDYRNDEGGIYGKKLVLSQELDDELSKNQEKALEVVTADDTFATFSAAQLASGWANLADAGIPTYVWAINPAQMTGKPEIFGNREITCIECTSRAPAYVAKLAGAKKVASIGYGVSDNSKLCAQGAADSIEKYSSDIGGAESAYLNDDLAFGLGNGIAPEVTAMKEAGVDLVLACIDLNGMKTLATELERQGMGDVTLYHANSYDQDFISQGGGIFDGDYVQATFRPFESDSASSSLDTYKEWMQKNGSELSEIAMVGWINADTAYQGIKAAGENFTRQSVIDATNQMTEYTASGLVAPIDWTRQHEAPTEDDPATHGPKYDCVSLVKVEDGKFVMVGDASKPWSCWPGDTRDWSEPTSMDFS
jgi:ABC-type branched-subunit amino acid transport system substrate-binding protein